MKVQWNLPDILKINPQPSDDREGSWTPTVYKLDDDSLFIMERVIDQRAFEAGLLQGKGGHWDTLGHFLVLKRGRCPGVLDCGSLIGGFHNWKRVQ